MPVISSILDNDLYKLSMQWAVLEQYPNAQVEYRFTNRGDQRFNDLFLIRLQTEIKNMQILALTEAEEAWLQKTIPFLPPQYIAYLKNYRYDPTEVETKLTEDNNLQLTVKGSWHSTILWEVPLLALISELYFKYVEVDWETPSFYDIAIAKSKRLGEAGCLFADFGTRRRRSATAHLGTISGLIDGSKNFVGTSNVHLAQLFNYRPIGTMAHEWIMGISELEGLKHANRHALNKWMEVYRARLGIALTDTFGTDAFFDDFDTLLAHSYDGVRHDSGDPFEFGEKTISAYKKLGIDPKSKTIVFSDSLNVDKAIAIQERFYGRIGVSFGIGTHFSNDIPDSQPLNIVIKLRSINNIDVVKLSDDPGKATGDRDALRVAMWTFFGKKLDTDIGVSRENTDCPD